MLDINKNGKCRGWARAGLLSLLDCLCYLLKITYSVELILRENRQQTYLAFLALSAAFWALSAFLAISAFHSTIFALQSFMSSHISCCAILTVGNTYSFAR